MRMTPAMVTAQGSTTTTHSPSTSGKSASRPAIAAKMPNRGHWEDFSSFLILAALITSGFFVFHTGSKLYNTGAQWYEDHQAKQNQAAGSVRGSSTAGQALPLALSLHKRWVYELDGTKREAFELVPGTEVPLTYS